MKIADYNGRSLSVFLALLVVSSAIVGVAAAATTYNASDINYGSDYVQKPAHHEQELEKQTHRMDGMSLTEYENDSGEVTSLPGDINESVDNPVSYRADLVNASDYRNGFGPNGESAINATLWTVDESGIATTGAGASVASDETPAGVKAVNFSTSGMASGDVATYTFDADVSQDPEKRVGQLVGNINTLDAGTEVQVIATDADGDDKTAYVNSSKDAGAKDVIANGTASGAVWQHKLGDLATKDVSTTGSGDGSFDGIDQIVIVVADGNAELVTPGMNYAKMSEWTFGTQDVDTDGDGEVDDSTTITEPTGYIEVTGLDTLGSTFDSATLYNVRFPVVYEASDLDDDDVSFEVQETDDGKYPNYGFKANVYYRLTVPSAYDLVHSGLSFEDTQTMPSDRYKTVEYAEGTGDTEFGNVSSWNDVTSSYSSEGATVTLDSTVEPGKSYTVHYEYVLTDSNKNEIADLGAPVGGGDKGGDQGLIGSALAVIASVLSVLGLGKIAGKISG